MKRIAAVLFFVFVACAKGQPRPTITWSQAPFCHNMKVYEDFTYSGHYALHKGQWDVLAVDTYPDGKVVILTPIATVVNGGSCPDGTSYRPAVHKIARDCYESVQHIAASPDVSKWVLSTGAPPTCKEIGTDHSAAQVQVMRLDAPGFRYVGQIFDTGIDRVGAEIRLSGDTAYVHKGRFGSDPWSIFDLNTLTKTGETMTPPVFTPQPNIDGYAYDLSGIIPNPVPVPFCGPCSFVLTRQGGVVTPSPSPVPPTLTPTPVCVPKVITVIVTATSVPRTATPIATKTRTAAPCVGCTRTPTPSFTQRTVVANWSSGWINQAGDHAHGHEWDGRVGPAPTKVAMVYEERKALYQPYAGQPAAIAQVMVLSDILDELKKMNSKRAVGP